MKGYAWHTAIGLQAVDGLKTSKYLIDTAIKNIEGDISIDEAQELLNAHYEEKPKTDIRNRLLSYSDMISEKTINHVLKLFLKCGKKEYFGRTKIEDITGLKSTRASELIKLLVDSEVIVPVTGCGKGKYRFQ